MAKNISKLVLGFSILAIIPTIALAEPGRIITGEPTLIDGDSLRVNNESIRLWGIDAFEANQMCGAMDCGQIATSRLSRIIQSANANGNQAVFCVEKTRDNHGRTVAICRINGVDLSAALVLQGFALAYREYSTDYVAEENFAKANKFGVWAVDFTNPWEFRRGSEANSNVAAGDDANQPPAAVSQTPPQQAPSSCNIKGNINSRGDRIYHTTSSPNYSRTVPERMFCSEAEARAAGFRAPRR